MNIILIIIGILFIIFIIFVFKKLSSVEERIKTLFRIYRTAKIKFPEKVERELLEIVIEEHIPSGKSIKLKNTGMTGKRYIDGVFESKPLDIDKLIKHIVTLEFPKKYQSYKISLDKIREQNRSGKLSSEEELELMIKDLHEKFLN